VFTLTPIDCTDPDHTYLSPFELAERLRCPLSRLTGWRKYGGGPEFTKFGKSVAYSVRAIHDWEKANTHRQIGDGRLSIGRRSR